MDIPDAAEVYPLVPELDENGQETGGVALKFPPQPDPEMEIKKADMQRRVLEGQSRAEADMMRAESDIMVNQAKVILMMAQAEVAADTPELERLKLIVKEFDDKRKTLVEMAKIEQTEETASNEGSDN
jgi:ribosomal protein L21